jgi:hypothetical protein
MTFQLRACGASFDMTGNLQNKKRGENPTNTPSCRPELAQLGSHSSVEVFDLHYAGGFAQFEKEFIAYIENK